MDDEDTIRRINIGYGLDGGGYSFEEAPERLGGAVMVWTDPDLDYLGLSDIMPSQDFYGLSCPVFAFAPNSGHFRPFDYPDTYEDDEGDIYKLVTQGSFNETDHDCHCHGKLVPWVGAAGEPPEPLNPDTVQKWADQGATQVSPDCAGHVLRWDFTGNTSDDPYPDCNRCDGDGCVVSPGGEWALYALEEDEEE